MKSRNIILIIRLFALIVVVKVNATNSYSKNIGFETGTFSGWNGYIWTFTGTSNGQGGTKTPKVKVNLPYAHRQEIISDTTAYDPNTGNKLKKVPRGSRYSARLGDAISGGLEESLTYTFTVDSTNALLVYKFAVILQDPLNNHTKIEEPRFKVTIFNQNGDTIPDCANYDVYASDGNIKGFQTYTSASLNAPVVWRDWTTVGANLLAYIGQKVTIEFMAADCTHTGHYGYAYFVADTQPLNIGVQYCLGDASAKLIAPDGFRTYSWKDSVGVIAGTNRILEITNPKEGARYSCNLASETGCNVQLTSKVIRFEPNADFKYNLVDCNNLSNTMIFTNIYPAVNGTLIYNWDFGDGVKSIEKNPVHVYNTSGLHSVKLVVSNPPSTCSDSAVKQVETFYPPLVGISGDSLYCKGSSTILKAYGAYRYLWSNGSTADSIRVGNDTTVWMIGYSSAGCYTEKKYFKVKQLPLWELTVNGNLKYCKGLNTVLTASGAQSYLWNTGNITNSVTITKPGIYSVTAKNKYGCQQSVSLNVVEDPLPNVDFTLSTPTIDSRHNILSCAIPYIADYQYSWDMGDGNTETGSTITHAYDVANNLYEYKITLTATNTNGCVNTNSKTVDIQPFVPNIFTPNGDGINDVFMAGLKLQIFDRFGLKLYDGKNGWDGQFNGKKMDNDTYFYLIYYTDKYQQTRTMKGYVTLKR